MFHKLKSCFQKEKVNITRQSEMDIARGLSVILMVITHIYESFSSFENPAAFMFFFNFCGGPFSAGVFMFCMGMNMCYSQKSTPKDYFKRGCGLFLTGLCLSIFTDLLPDLFFAIAEENTSFIQDLPVTIAYMIAKVDIFQFSGIFFMIFAWIKKANWSLLQINFFAILLCIAGQFLRYEATENICLNILTGFFWVTHYRVWFPFFNWFIVPILGYTFGHYWLHCHEKETFFRIVTPVSGILALGFFILSNGYQNLDYYYGLGILEAVFTCFTAIAMIGCGYFAFRHFKGSNRLIWLSKSLTPLYCTHWVLISCISPAVYILWGKTDFAIPDLFVLPVSIVILLASCFCVKIYYDVSKTARK